MKKVFENTLKGVLLLLFVFLFKTANVEAASCNISVSAPSSAVVGNSFRVTVTVSSNASLGSWTYNLSYNTSMVRLTSGDLHVVDYGNGSKKSASYAYTFTSLASGSAYFKITNASVIDYDSTSECLSNSGSASVSMKTQAEIEASYSRNNNLASLSVDGAQISPAFGKDTLQYTASLPVDTEKAVIKAQAEDENAMVSGTGEVAVLDGVNKLEIVVTSQHGEKKTYTITLTVLEQSPIKVNIDGKSYTLVRKKGQIKDVPDGFLETTIKIKNQDIAAFKNKKANLTLVGLKDKKGNIKLFIYDDGNYENFNYTKTTSNSLVVLSAVKNDKFFMYKKVTLDFNGNKVKANKLLFGKNKNYYVVYAKDLKTGNEAFYLYDKTNNVFEKYNDDFETDAMYRSFAILGLAGVLLLIILVKIIKAIMPRDRKIKKLEKKIEHLKKKKSISTLIDDDFDVPKNERKQKEIDPNKMLSKNSKIRKISLDDDDEEDEEF